jgi:hypothetical protein
MPIQKIYRLPRKILLVYGFGILRPYNAGDTTFQYPAQGDALCLDMLPFQSCDFASFVNP